MKKINKTIYRNALIGALLIFASISCQDQLELSPISNYTSENYFENVQHAEIAVNGIYDILSEHKNTSYTQFLSFVAPVDNDVTYFADIPTKNMFAEMAHYAGDPFNAGVLGVWGGLFEGLNRANWAIHNIQEMDEYTNGTDEEKQRLNELLGEAMFLRAFYSFDLVRLFGDVPYKTKPTVFGDEFEMEKTDREQIYDQMINDLNQAKELLPDKPALTNERANQAAVRGYLVRILLYRSGYSLRQSGVNERPANYTEYIQQAAVEAKELISNSASYGVQLNSDYERIFKNFAERINDPSESLFEIAFYDVAQEQNVGKISSHLGVKVDAKSSFGRGLGKVFIRPQFKAEFDENDLRRDVAVAEFTIKKGDVYAPLKAANPKFPGKWRRDWNIDDPLNKNNTNVNWCMLRYADVLLMLAEAVNETRDNLPSGVTVQDAFDAINAVRVRAGIETYPTSLSQDELRAAIRHERKLELVGEGWRKFDLIRWGILGESLRATKALMDERYGDAHNLGYFGATFFEDNKDELFPVPQREIDENYKLVQNPGY